MSAPSLQRSTCCARAARLNFACSLRLSGGTFSPCGPFRLDALGLGHGVHGRLQVVELGMYGLERLFHFLRDDGLVKPVACGDSADRADGDGPAHDEHGAAKARRAHQLHGNSLDARLFELLRGVCGQRGQLLAAVDGLAQERELLLHGLDLFFASHIWSLPCHELAFQSATGAPLSTASTSVSPR